MILWTGSTINNALVCQILSKMFTDMDAYVYVKQEKKCRSVKQCSSMSVSNVLALTMWLGRPQKQKESCKPLAMMMRKGWDWDKYIALHKEQHAIMESLTVEWTMASLPLSPRHQEY